MKIQTFSIVVGGPACNAHCPYCVSKMTKGCEHKEIHVENINMRNFRKACNFAKMSGVSTALLTGVGEPTLYKSHIEAYLKVLKEFDFPFVELQTNGIELTRLDGGKDTHKWYDLKDWYDYGLTTVSLSCVHYEDNRNKEIFGDKWASLSDNIKLLHRNGLSVRVSCVMLDKYIGSIDEVHGMIDFCRKNNVEQLTVRPVTAPEDSENQDIRNWVYNNKLQASNYEKVQNHFHDYGFLLLDLAHGAKVYDYYGQNISVNSCLTHSPNLDEVRQLIFQPDGHIRFSWTHAGAILI